MKPTLSTLVAVVVPFLGACGGNQPLGANPNGSPKEGSGTAGSPAGTAGTAGSPTGFGGSGPSTGSTGSGGTAGTGTLQPRPLQIAGAEAVARLARVLWIDLPDEDLLMQAEQGQFTTASDLVPVIRKMLADPRAAKGVGAFYRWWLDLDGVSAIKKDATLFPAFTPALASDMALETETFAVSVTLDRNGSYPELMTSPATFLNARLADLYDVPGITGDGLQSSPVDPYKRAGLFTQPAILVQGTNLAANDPSLRGAFIDTKFLCLQIPAPPPDENSFPTPPPGETVRTALTAAVSNTVCQVCHQLLDPQGYALESFDAIGRWRTMDNGGLVDTTGLDIGGLVGAPTPAIDGPIALSSALTGMPKAQQCMVRQWYAYVLHQKPGDVADALVTATYPIFRGAELNLQALIVAVLTSDAFLAPFGIE